MIGATDGGRILEVALDPTADEVEWEVVTALDASEVDKRRLTAR